MRIGYAFWGFLSDVKIENGLEISSPDGNASYSWSILHEAQKRGWDSVLLQKDRDAESVRIHLFDSFASFSTEHRYKAWRRSYKTITSDNDIVCKLSQLPKLDVALIEWRFPIAGRNCDVDKGDPQYQEDLDRQIEILEYLKISGTKIILWDLDHKLTIDDEIKWEPDAIFETSVEPLHQHIKRIRVEPPIVWKELKQHITRSCLPGRKLVYIGSRYERDDVIDEWIRPTSEKFPFQVEFWGNWTREPNLSECRDMWPFILYNRRITMANFREVYATAVACPILAKKSYLEVGFITPRPWEALLFGTIPVGIASHNGIEQYVDIVAKTPENLADIVENMSALTRNERHDFRMANIEKLKFMDVSNFFDKIEEIAC